MVKADLAEDIRSRSMPSFPGQDKYIFAESGQANLGGGGGGGELVLIIHIQIMNLVPVTHAYTEARIWW